MKKTLVLHRRPAYLSSPIRTAGIVEGPRRHLPPRCRRWRACRGRDRGAGLSSILARQIDIAFLSGDTARRELRSSLGRLGALRFLRLRLGLREALEEERDRHAQRLAQPIEATGAYTILALLVFVQVLKRDPQFSRKFWLGYSQLMRRSRTRIPT